MVNIRTRMCRSNAHRGNMAKKNLKQETSEKVSFQIIPEVTLSDIAVKLDKIIELLQQIKLPRGGY